MSVSAFVPTSISKMDLFLLNNALPQEEIPAICRSLKFQSKSPRHVLLAEFLRQATTAFRDEAALLPKAKRSELPIVESILDLCNNESLARGGVASAIEGALLIVLELGLLIGHYEVNPSTYARLGDNYTLFGLGIGTLAACAVSISPLLMHLPLAGAAAVRYAFRLGILVDDVSQNFESISTDAISPSWAYVVLGVAENDLKVELSVLNEKAAKGAQLFISASNSRCITVSGPPSTLERAFVTSDLLRYSKFAALPVYTGLCHAPHLYTTAHASEIVDIEATRRLKDAYKPIYPVLSTESARTLDMTSCAHVFKDAIMDILSRSIRLDIVTSELLSSRPNSIRTFFADSRNPFLDLRSTLEKNDAGLSNVDFTSWIREDQQSTSAAIPSLDSSIAIVGMACRFPGGADDLDSFWEILEGGLDVHSKIPPDRFDIGSHYDSSGNMINSTLTQYGCFINEPGKFDPSFFNMSAREALETDPIHRLALVTAYEALERAGFVPHRTRSSEATRVGTFYGQASDDYREVNSSQNIGTYFISGGCRAFAPGRISYFFSFGGPSISCDTACSSSLAAIQQACTALLVHDADTIVAGGLNVLSNPDAFAGLGRGHFLSSTGGCKTWDSGADGYCRADGVGSVVLKRLEDAQADNDNILGVILASATNHSGDAISITHPHAPAQARLYRDVLSRANVDPHEVSFVEFHGTGTQAGDSVEMESVLEVFAPTAPKRIPTQPLHIGAVKSNVGHGEAAAGIMALIKVLCMLQKDSIPPHIGIKNKINPAIPQDLKMRNVHIPTELKSWSQETYGRQRKAMVNNFSAAGGNTSLLIQEAPARKVMSHLKERRSHVIALSAKSKASLLGNIESLVSYLNENPDVFLESLSYTTCARRMHHPLRTTVVGSSVAEVRGLLSQNLLGLSEIRPVSSQSIQQVAFSFAGQGTFHVGAGRALYQDIPRFAAEIQRLSRICELHGFPDIDSIISGNVDDSHISPLASSLAMICIEIALATLWKLLGVQPTIVIGHSLGEYAALHVAGVLSASDVIYLVGARTQLILRVCEIKSHSMLAVKASTGQIEDCLRGLQFEFACKNSELENVVVGTNAQLDVIREQLQKDGYRCHVLDVPFAYHSAQMEPILDTFEDIASRAIFHSPSLPVISPLRAKTIFDAKTFNARYLRDATRRCVEFTDALHAAAEMGLIDNQTAWVDVSCHPILVPFIRSAIPETKTLVSSMNRKEDSWTTLATSCAKLHTIGVPLDWDAYHQPFNAGHRLLNLPKYVWDNKTYWIPYTGTWALSKGNDSKGSSTSSAPHSPLSTSSVQRVVHLKVEKPDNGSILIESDVMHPDFLAAAWGHKMNDHAVVTSSIHADIAFTVAKFLYDQVLGTQKHVYMDIVQFEVFQALIANLDTSKPQLIEIKASIDFTKSQTAIQWYNKGEETALASAVVQYTADNSHSISWSRTAHLLTSRIASLAQLARDGVASTLSRTMAYKLFANLVDYADAYRGMHSVTMLGMEAYATVKLTKAKKGTWTIPPIWTDSLVHLAGLVMNGSDALDTKDNFYVTKGWDSMFFAEELKDDRTYTSYVHMFPVADRKGFWEGDVWVLDGERIMGCVTGIKFRQFPRSLLPTFFSPREPQQIYDETARSGHHQWDHLRKAPSIETQAIPSLYSASSLNNSASFTGSRLRTTSISATPIPPASPPSNLGAAALQTPSTTTQLALAIIAREIALESGTELDDDASFVQLGIDSLLSLVLVEKFEKELDIKVTGTMFMEWETVGEFRRWVGERY